MLLGRRGLVVHHEALRTVPPAHRVRRRYSMALAALSLLAASTSHAAASRDTLWRIVSECLEPAAPAYCSRCPWPIEGACGGEGGCLRSTEVWAESRDYVAIRDIKMCGCPAGFVHGLALPRGRVSGVEDAHRPAGLWAFAWQAARSRIMDEEEIALVVNPARLRTQDQLHVHLVRLARDARPRLAARAPAKTPALDDVWTVAARQAAAAGLVDYGVLVARAEGGGGFAVLVEAASPEYQYTVATCR